MKNIHFFSIIFVALFAIVGCGVNGIGAKSTNGVKLGDFAPLIANLESTKNQNELDSMQDSSKGISEDSIMAFFTLAQHWQSDNLADLEAFIALAKSKEEREFIEQYLLWQRFVIIQASYSAINDNGGGWFGDPNRSPQERINAAQSKLVRIFNNQIAWFLSFKNSGLSPFGYLLDNEAQKVCVDASCGHVNEVFIIQNMIHSLKNKTDIKFLESVAQHGLDGYSGYGMLSFTEGVISDVAKNLDFRSLSEAEMKNLLEYLKPLIEAMEGDSGTLLDKFGRHFIYFYLSDLYSTKDYLNLVNLSKSDIKERGDIAKLCVNPSLLNKDLREFCLENLQQDSKQTAEFLKFIKSTKLSGKSVDFFIDNRFCASAKYDDDLALHIFKGQNDEPYCKTIQEILDSTKDLEDKNSKPSLESSTESLSKADMKKLAIINHSSFGEFLKMRIGFLKNNKKVDIPKFNELCQKGEVASCGIVGMFGDKKITIESKMLDNACELGDTNACRATLDKYLTKNIKADSHFLKHANNACEMGDDAFCHLLGVAYSGAKHHIDFSAIKKDMQKSYEYFNQGCLAGSFADCSRIIHNIDEFSKLGFIKDRESTLKKLCSIDLMPNKACETHIEPLFEAMTIDAAGIHIDAASIHNNEKPLSQDEIKILENACESGFGRSCRDLTNIHYPKFYKDDGKKRKEKSKWAAKMGCDNNHKQSCAILSYLYDEPELSIPLLKKSCDLPSRADMGTFGYSMIRDSENEDCRLVGVAYQKGYGVAKNANLAKLYLYKACQNDDVESCEILANILK